MRGFALRFSAATLLLGSDFLHWLMMSLLLMRPSRPATELTVQDEEAEHIQNLVRRGNSISTTAADFPHREVRKRSSSLEGGTVPAYALQRASKAGVALIGTGLPTDNIHAPNEHFTWDSFKQGFLVICNLFESLS